MILLIDYDRSIGRIVSMRAFDSAQRHDAEDARLAIELALNRRGVDHEVVLLEAESEEDIRRTHQRYFRELREALEDWQRDIAQRTEKLSRQRPASIASD